MASLRTAVIGTGHLGRIHARLAAEAPHIDLVAVVDVCESTRDQVAQQTGARPVASYHEVLGEIEAAIVATPTTSHHRVVRDLLQAGKHVLVEKPITTTVAEADELIEIAKDNNLTLQVGHVERFNPGLACVAEQLQDIRYIQGTRASGFTFRSTDIGVVMDLMIHDIDVVLSLVQSRVTNVFAFGIAIIGNSEDIAQAQLQFANGCIAQLTASRVNYQPARSMQVFSSDRFANIDFAARQATTITPHPALLNGEFDLHSLTVDQTNHYREHLFEELLVKQDLEPEQTNAIAEEHRDFAEAIRNRRQVRVTGDAGRAALEVADRVLASISTHHWDSAPLGRRGARMVPAIPYRKAG